jgi:3-dehydroshikimate dehydratase
MLIPGLVSVTFRNKTAEEIIGLCAKAGLKAVEWGENAHVFPGNTVQSRALARKCADAGIQIAAYGSYYRLGERMDFTPSLESAAALGAPLIRIWAGTKPSADVDASLFTRLAEEAASVAEKAAVMNIKIALEWHKNTLTDTNSSAAQFLETVNNHNLYCLWQPAAALTEAERCTGLTFLADPRASKFGERLANIHVYYWKDGVRRPLSEGTDAWKRYLSVLEHDNETRFLLLEFVMDDTEAQFFQDAVTLHTFCVPYKTGQEE